MNIFVLNIEHENGRNVTGHHTKEEARKELLAFVDRWWDKEMDCRERPDDPEQRIDEYFEHVQHEYGYIAEVEV